MESQSRVANGCLRARKAIEKPAKTRDAYRHHAHCSAGNGRSRTRRRELNIEGSKPARCKQARGLKVIRHSAQMRLVLRLEAVNKRAIGTGASHHHKIPSARIADNLANWNGARLAAYLLERCLAWIG